jgi:nucleoside-diphosphate-sugar epimerase
VKYLVTGAAGFIVSFLQKVCSQRYQVMTFDNPNLLAPIYVTSTVLHSHPDRTSTQLGRTTHYCLTQKNNVFISLATDSLSFNGDTCYG